MADVKKINGMNINDETSRINIGCTQDTYSNEKTYVVGDIVVYNNTIYKCITAITESEEFDPAKWMVTTIVNELKNRLEFEVVEETTE